MGKHSPCSCGQELRDRQRRGVAEGWSLVRGNGVLVGVGWPIPMFAFESGPDSWGLLYVDVQTNISGKPGLGEWLGQSQSQIWKRRIHGLTFIECLASTDKYMMVNGTFQTDSLLSPKGHRCPTNSYSDCVPNSQRGWFMKETNKFWQVISRTCGLKAWGGTF